jgi:hypothetical protein
MCLRMKDDRGFYQLNYELSAEPDHVPYIWQWRQQK